MAKGVFRDRPSFEERSLISRRFVRVGDDPYALIKWTRRSSKIVGADGKCIFSLENVEVPETWSQLATDIAASKYFRRAGVPLATLNSQNLAGEALTGGETSVRDLIFRVTKTIREAGEAQQKYFRDSSEADTFEIELAHILLHQLGAFNSPVWFNCGLYQRYHIAGSGGQYAVQLATDKVEVTTNAYERPQCSACFIQSVDDDLMGLFDLLKNEARLFKYGSGTGTNFSKIRGSNEPLSGGGLSSGLMSFLKVFDTAAGATKSGGTTRRAAKMVCLDVDHPEIFEFIEWKANEEKKVAALIKAGYSSDFNGEAYQSVTGQNANLSVRLTDAFMKAVENDDNWELKARTTGETVEVVKARELWHRLASAAWSSADPGVQFDSTIQHWHTCPVSGQIKASNPCSEFMFLDDTACNLASINLIKFIDDSGRFDLESFRHTARLLLVAQDILVDFSSYPTATIAQNSHRYRPLGLGYANLGATLMAKGWAYDSDEGRRWSAWVTSILAGEAYLTSAELAREMGAFAGFAPNRSDMLRVIRQHREALRHLTPQALGQPQEAPGLSVRELEAAEQIWQRVESEGEKFGFRNSQVTVLAPTGTIGLLMDCDTTGVEPDFALVKFKKLAGGGRFKIVNQSVPRALKFLGYGDKQVEEMIVHLLGTMRLESSGPVSITGLKRIGLNDHDINKVEQSFASITNLEMAFSPAVLGAQTLKRLGWAHPKDALKALGLSRQMFSELSQKICGHMNLEHAPYLRGDHVAIFDCAVPAGPSGSRSIRPRAHLLMMAAVQPFLSGAISKTVNVPYDTSVEDIEGLYFESWQLGLKSVALYRDGSKFSQPLNAAPKDTVQEESDKITAAQVEHLIQQALLLAPARRRNLPQKRPGFTLEIEISGQKFYLRTGEYEDGRLGEIFLDMHKEGATLRSLLNCFAIAVSVGLQYGVPLEEFVRKFTFTRFEPAGITNHPNIRQATSVVDLVFRVLGMEYLGETDYVHPKPDPQQLKFASKGNSSETKNGADHSVPAQMNIAEQLSSILSEPHNGREFEATQATSDAPFCSSCGHLTVRNGACFKCMNCGHSEACS